MLDLTAFFSNPDILDTIPSEKMTYQANSLILSEDDNGQDLYLILSGEAEVCCNLHDDEYHQPARVAHLRANDIFGELSLFESGPRTAEVKALTDCEVLKLNGPALTAYLDTRPADGYFVLKELFLRLIVRMRQNKMRTKMALQMYFHEHADD